MNKEKTILFFHHAPHFGGASISGSLFIKALIELKYNVIVYCNSKKPDTVNFYKKLGFEVIEAQSSPVSFLHYVGDSLFVFSFRAILNYLRIIKDIKIIQKTIFDIKPDIVIVNSMTLFWIGKIAKKNKIETILIFRETMVRGLFGLRSFLIKKAISKNFDKVSFISKFDFYTNSKLAAKKFIIYNAVNKENKVNAINKINFGVQKVKDCKYVLYLGGFHKLKGAEVLIRAINELKNQKIIFVFVGIDWLGEKKLQHCNNFYEKIKFVFNVDYEKKCIKLIYKFNIRSKIIFYPPTNDISILLKSSDLLVNPMMEPHQARPIIESVYYNKPFLITDFENHYEFTNKNRNLIFPKGNYKILSKKIFNSLNNNSNFRIEASFYNKLRKNIQFDSFILNVQKLLRS